MHTREDVNSSHILCGKKILLSDLPLLRGLQAHAAISWSSWLPGITLHSPNRSSCLSSAPSQRSSQRLHFTIHAAGCLLPVMILLPGFWSFSYSPPSWPTLPPPDALAVKLLLLPPCTINKAEKYKIPDISEDSGTQVLMSCSVW
jgi:hypothetical protein